MLESDTAGSVIISKAAALSTGTTERAETALATVGPGRADAALSQSVFACSEGTAEAEAAFSHVMPLPMSDFAAAALEDELGRADAALSHDRLATE